ncbi:RWD domain-containing protein 1-like [Styela clava]
MTDHEEEQNTEIEALESIYYDSFQVISEKPRSFELTVTVEDAEEDENIFAKIQFTYTPTYPDEAPIYELIECENLSAEDEEKIKTIIEKEIEDNLGMVMIFTVVTAIQEFLNDVKDGIKRREQDEKERHERELEAEENKKFHGTPVTVETFLVWKLKFDEEMKELQKLEMKMTEKRKMTGKELFLSDAKLLENEFLEGETEGVTIDESLFEDLDDLDFEDSDDPDFDPALCS